LNFEKPRKDDGKLFVILNREKIGKSESAFARSSLIFYFIFYLNSENMVAWKLSTILGKQL